MKVSVRRGGLTHQTGIQTNPPKVHDIPEREIKILFAKSGNLCAFPKCGTRLVEPIADHVGDTSRKQLLQEVLALTKMNWNLANYSGLMPITLRFARLVGAILREVPTGQGPEPKYKYYM
jgi:hypothetical protein